MKRGIYLILALAVAFTMLATSKTVAARGGNTSYFFDFERSLHPFVAGADNPGGVTPQTLTLGYESDPTDTTDLGNRYALLSSDTSHLVYMIGQIKGSGIAVRVQFLARNQAACDGCAVVVAVSSASGDNIAANFQKVGSFTDGEWTYFEYQGWLDGEDPLVAIGMVSANGMDVTRQMAVDNLQVSFLDD